jgi:hypothetical protein
VDFLSALEQPELDALLTEARGDNNPKARKHAAAQALREFRGYRD